MFNLTVIKQKQALAFDTEALLAAFRRQTVLVIMQKQVLAFDTEAFPVAFRRQTVLRFAVSSSNR